MDLPLAAAAPSRGTRAPALAGSPALCRGATRRGPAAGRGRRTAQLWRLSVLPFVALLVFFSWRSARSLGAAGWRAALGSLVVALSPLSLQVTTGLMTDIAYLALLMGGGLVCATLAFGARSCVGRRRLRPDGDTGANPRGVDSIGSHRRYRHAQRMAAALGPSERPRLLCWGRRRVGCRRPYALGLATPAMNRPLGAQSLLHTLPNLVGTVIEGPIMLALILLPVVPLLLPAAGRKARPRPACAPLRHVSGRQPSSPGSFSTSAMER